MRRLSLPLSFLLALVLCLAPTVDLTAQTQPLRPVTVGSAMPDFTLPVFQGGEITLSDLRGQNVMVVFPRGLSRPGSWCHICPYQHSELVEYEAQTNWQARANLKILFVLPYGQEMIAEWVDAYPQLLQDIEDGKNPPNAGELDDAGRARIERQKQIYPKAIPSAAMGIAN